MVSTDSGFYNAPTNKEIGDTDLQSMISPINDLINRLLQTLDGGARVHVLVQVCTVNYTSKLA